mmetsp:Transcript_609/g.1276  ORF Transcript_609/g.1276 Transcript_609/m.1276 type:complete len:282 (+) Transcript_609:809-1654(+)
MLIDASNSSSLDHLAREEGARRRLPAVVGAVRARVLTDSSLLNAAEAAFTATAATSDAATTCTLAATDPAAASNKAAIPAVTTAATTAATPAATPAATTAATPAAITAANTAATTAATTVLAFKVAAEIVISLSARGYGTGTAAAVPCHRLQSSVTDVGARRRLVNAAVSLYAAFAAAAATALKGCATAGAMERWYLLCRRHVRMFLPDRLPAARLVFFRKPLEKAHRRLHVREVASRLALEGDGAPPPTGVGHVRVQTRCVRLEHCEDEDGEELVRPELA